MLRADTVPAHWWSTTLPAGASGGPVRVSTLVNRVPVFVRRTDRVAILIGPHDRVAVLVGPTSPRAVVVALEMCHASKLYDGSAWCDERE